MTTFKCKKCGKEEDLILSEEFIIKISSDYSYRYGRLYLCRDCFEETEQIFHLEPFYKALEIILEILKKET